MRNVSYEDDPALALGLPVVYVQELDDDRIQAFIEKRGGGDLWAQIRNDPARLRLAQNPYNLVMLIEVYAGGQGGLPDNVSQLYDL